MHTTTLRKVGGSVMLAVPPALLDILELGPGAKVGISIETGRLVVESQPRHRYSLEQLLSQCTPRSRRSERDRRWARSKAVGRELL